MDAFLKSALEVLIGFFNQQLAVVTLKQNGFLKKFLHGLQKHPNKYVSNTEMDFKKKKHLKNKKGHAIFSF